MNEQEIKRLTSIDLRERPEGVRLSYAYSVINESGKIIDNNIRGSFVILDDMSIEISGESKSVIEAAKVLLKAAADKLK